MKRNVIVLILFGAFLAGLLYMKWRIDDAREQRITRLTEIIDSISLDNAELNARLSEQVTATEHWLQKHNDLELHTDTIGGLLAVCNANADSIASQLASTEAACAALSNDPRLGLSQWLRIRGYYPDGLVVTCLCDDPLQPGPGWPEVICGGK